MWKVLFDLPWNGPSITSFSIALAVACFAALKLTAWRARREGLPVATVYDLAFWLISGGFLGARMLFIAMHAETLHSPLDIFKVWQGGIVFYGCIIGGLIGSCIFYARHPFPFRAMADAVAPALCLGVAIGRLGCFFNGCCFGARSNLPWAVRFPADSAPWAAHVQNTWVSITSSQSLPVHPTQLYAAFNGFLLLGVLTLYYPHRRRDGEVFALAMLTYPVFRFLEESLRDDEAGILLGLTLSQCISVLIFVVGLCFCGYLSTFKRGRHCDAVARVSTKSTVSTRPFDESREPFLSEVAAEAEEVACAG